MPIVLKSLLSSEMMPKFENLDLGSDASERRLGLIWNINTDKLSFKPVTKIFPGTKRGILSMISTIYSPLGNLTPVLLKLQKSFKICGKEVRLGWEHTTSIVSTVECMETRFREHHQNIVKQMVWFS